MLMPMMLVMEGWFWLVMMSFEMGSDGGVEMTGSPALFLIGGGVELVAGQDVAQHEDKKIYYKLTSAD
jgi:hypothetical protein